MDAPVAPVILNPAGTSIWNCEGSPCTTVTSARATIRMSASLTETRVLTSRESADIVKHQRHHLTRRPFIIKAFELSRINSAVFEMFQGSFCRPRKMFVILDLSAKFRRHVLQPPLSETVHDSHGRIVRMSNRIT